MGIITRASRVASRSFSVLPAKPSEMARTTSFANTIPSTVRIPVTISRPDSTRLASR
jgi:hypothetical protein